MDTTSFFFKRWLHGGIRESKMPSTTKLIAFLLGQYMEKSRGVFDCNPSQRTIAQGCSLDKRTVINHIKKLQEWGYIVIEKERWRDSDRIHNRYYAAIAGKPLSVVYSEESPTRPYGFRP